jgi:transcriptional regulator of acetoin/glycerol metabolism
VYLGGSFFLELPDTAVPRNRKRRFRLRYETREQRSRHSTFGILRKRQGNISHAATALGMSRVALQKKIKRFALR